jgi:hypothetical protein
LTTYIPDAFLDDAGFPVWESVRGCCRAGDCEHARRRRAVRHRCTGVVSGWRHRRTRRCGANRR